MKFHSALAAAASALLILMGLSVRGEAAGGGGGSSLEIVSTTKRYEGQTFIAEGNVVIAVGEQIIYCDYAQYDAQTENVLVSGNVRIFRNGTMFMGDRAIYNVLTKQFMGAAFRTSSGPFLAEAHTLRSGEKGALEATRGLFTTDDVADPSFSMRAEGLRFFPNDHMEATNVRLYIGRVPVLWLPYVYVPTDRDQSFSLEPGSRGMWGPFLLTRFALPITERIGGAVRADYLSRRGFGVGFDAGWADPTDGRAWGRFQSYYIDDQNPGTFQGVASAPAPAPAPAPVHIQPNRYRLSFQDRSYLTDRLYTSLSVNKVSDVLFLRDFAPSEMRHDPNPDTVLALTKWDEEFTLTLQARTQLNRDFESTSRLPELALDVPRQPFLDSGVFYEGETSAGKFQRRFGKFSALTSFDTVREDTFHQWSYPKVWGGWLSVVPKLGVRATHYSRSVFDAAPTEGDPLYAQGGSLTRLTGNVGLEASFKLSRTFESVESRAWGLDGLRHVVQPFTEWSLVSSNTDASRILQFDRLRATTRLPAIDLAQFNSLDSITDWQVVRLGVRNRLQTRRDDETLNWLEVESYLDGYVQRPQFVNFPVPAQNNVSNVFNRLRWKPLPWVDAYLDTQLPILEHSFREVSSQFTFQVNRDVHVQIGNRYLSGHPTFADSNLITGGARVRLNDNWAVSFLNGYDFATKISESQQYSIDRDLHSWVASFSLLVRELDSRKDIAVLLSLSLKDIPKIGIPLKYDNAAAAGTGKSR